MSDLRCSQCGTVSTTGLFYCSKCDAPLPGSAAWERQRSSRTARKLYRILAVLAVVLPVGMFLVRAGVLPVLPAIVVMGVLCLLFCVGAVAYSAFGVKGR